MGFEDITKITAVAFYETSGTRIASQYFDDLIPKEKREKFEKEVLRMANEDPSSQILQYDNKIILVRLVEDFFVFVIAKNGSNELLVEDVLKNICVAIGIIFKGKGRTDQLIKQVDLLYLLIDETISYGYVFEANPEVIAARVMLKDDAAFAGKASKDMSAY